MTFFLDFIIFYICISLIQIFHGYFFAGLYEIKRKRRLSKYEPFISVIVPTYNEDPGYLEQCIKSLCINDYKNKEVIVINDGSSNKNCIKSIKDLKKKYDFVFISYNKNQGKRFAMYKGIKKASGEIIVTVDSDTIIPNGKCFRYLVREFKDRKIGAVCGQALIKNRNENFLTKMQDAFYYQAFKIFKSAQASYNGVTCTPGCFSAYRTEYLVPFLDDWVNEQVLGKKMDFGDDRALTTLLIKDYEIYYEPEALVYTFCPTTHRKFLKQQLRWKKSYVIETLKLSKQIRNKNALIKFEYILTITLFILGFIAETLIFYFILVEPTNLFWFLFMVGLISLLRYSCCFVYNEFRRGFYGVCYIFYNFFVVSWLYPVAILNLDQTRWGTR